MKVGRSIKSGFKWSFKNFINVHEWIGLRTIGTMSRGLINAIKQIFVPQTSERAETFDEAVKRLNLSPADLETRQRVFLRIAIMMAFLSLLCLFYMLYLLFSGLLAAGLLAFIVALIVLAYAWRFHFWYFQLKNKKLGCTIQEWFNAKAGGGE